MSDAVARTAAAAAFCEHFRGVLHEGGIIPTPDLFQINGRVVLSSNWDVIEFTFACKGRTLDTASLVRCADEVFSEVDTFELFDGERAGTHLCRITGCQQVVERAAEQVAAYSRRAFHPAPSFAARCASGFWTLVIFAAVVLVVSAFWAAA